MDPFAFDERVQKVLQSKEISESRVAQIEQMAAECGFLDKIGKIDFKEFQADIELGRSLILGHCENWEALNYNLLFCKLIEQPTKWNSPNILSFELQRYVGFDPQGEDCPDGEFVESDPINSIPAFSSAQKVIDNEFVPPNTPKAEDSDDLYLFVRRVVVFGLLGIGLQEIFSTLQKSELKCLGSTLFLSHGYEDGFVWSSIPENGWGHRAVRYAEE